MQCLSDPNDRELFPFFKSSNPRSKSENPMVQLFYGTFLTEGVREGKFFPLNVDPRPVTVSVLLEKAFESGSPRSEYWFYLLSVRVILDKRCECLDPQPLHL